MNDRAEEGIGWTLVALLCGLGAAATRDPLLKLIACLGAIGGTAKAAECFQSTASAAYRQLVNAQPYRRLSHGA